MDDCDKFKLEADTDTGDNVDARRVGESLGRFSAAFAKDPVEHIDIG